MQLGCYAVRNRSTKEIIDDQLTFAERNEKEQSFFFDKNGWQRDIDPGHVEIDNLRACLAKTLYKHVVSNFPDLKDDMRAATKDLAKELKSLGDPRSTPEAQRSFLLGLQSDYRKNVERCLRGHYLPGIPETHPPKLRNHVRRLCDDFDHVVRSEGLQYPFIDPVSGYDPMLAIPTADKLRNDILAKGDTYAWILQKWDTLRGPEAPLDPPSTVKQMLFEEQISSWAELAEDHLTEVIRMIDDCNHFLFERICPDKEIRQGIRGELHKAESEAKIRAEEELSSFIQDHSQRLHTSDPRLKTEFDATKVIRTTMAVDRVQHQSVTQAYQITATLQTNASLSSEVYEIHDYLRAYCGIMMSHFIDNVAIQVIERHLLGRSGPLATFTSQWVGGRSNQELENLVGEKMETKVRRQQLEKNLEVLKDAVSRAERLGYAQA